MLLFILGIIFALIGIPILTCLSESIYLVWECIKSKINIVITKNNIIVSDLSTQLEKTNTHVIGFDVPSEVQYDDEFEFNDKIKYRPMNKIGFNR